MIDSPLHTYQKVRDRRHPLRLGTIQRLRADRADVAWASGVNTWVRRSSLVSATDWELPPTKVPCADCGQTLTLDDEVLRWTGEKVWRNWDLVDADDSGAPSQSPCRVSGDTCAPVSVPA